MARAERTQKMTDKRHRINRVGNTYQKSPYPKTDTSEVTSVNTFRHLIDESRVKSHIEVVEEEWAVLREQIGY